MTKHTFNDIEVSKHISLIDVDIEFHLNNDMEFTIEIKKIGLVVIDDVEFNNSDNQSIYKALQGFYQSNIAKKIIESKHYEELLDVLKQEEKEHLEEMAIDNAVSRHNHREDIQTVLAEKVYY